MKVVISPSLGFCKGVEAALKKASEYASLLNEDEDLYFFGEIVHNKKVMEAFLSRGGKVVTSPDEIERKGILIIRAHGIPDKIRQEFEKKGIRIVDCTCPVVLKGQRLVRESTLPVVILGYLGHSEVESLYGAGRGETEVVSSPSDLDKLKEKHYRGVVQTTFSSSLLRDILEKASKKGIVIDVVNSICMASLNRRHGVEKTAQRVDAIVVVGASHSANARELVETGKRAGRPSFLVEDVEDIPREVFSYKTIGVTAGASTPRQQYQRVIEKLEDSGNGE